MLAMERSQNVNISAAVALAGIGLDRTQLLIVADPTIDTHVVEVEAAGAFGRYTFAEDVAISEHRKTASPNASWPLNLSCMLMRDVSTPADTAVCVCAGEDRGDGRGQDGQAAGRALRHRALASDSTRTAPTCRGTYLRRWRDGQGERCAEASTPNGSI